MPDIRNLAIWILLALAVAGWGGACAERTRAGVVTKQRNDAREEAKGLRGAIDAQKAEAAATLRTLNASVLAQQKRIDAAHAAQEKNDAQNLATVGALRDQLRRERMQRGAEAAGRGDGGGGAPGQAGAGAHAGAAGAAQAGGPLPDETAAEAEERDAYDADELNEAYRSCRVRVMQLADR
ncbi:hypothetical protein [Xenophilus sp. Marseille-Q4582]|uniref:hypothetical protein n=1 Tax=Xenophilus sp. Marseille-Q4582 TaxID=2866600 RepID=UPI001CE4926E|nr:hypothetical protein [Xenophilus sp. Marseille-Q4582]